MVAPNAAEKVQSLMLSEIEVNPLWNARSNLEDSYGGTDEGEGFGGLVKSIALKGQDTAIIVRAQKGRKPFSLVAGFRRYAAIAKIAEETGEKNPTIRAVVRELSESEARELNLRENTARDNLSGPDLAFGVASMIESNKTLTDTAIAETLGMNQGYISKLHRIMGSVRPNILKDWRASTLKLTVDQMASLVAVPKDEQQAKYDTMVRGKEEGSARGPGAWVDTAKKNAAKIGATLGCLARDGHITLLGNDFFGVNIRTLVQFKATATENQVAKIAGACEKAFSVARETIAESEDVKVSKKGTKGPNGTVDSPSEVVS